MTAAVESLITSLRKKNAEEEAKIVAQKKQEVINQAKRTESLAKQAKASQGAIDKFVADLKKGKKKKDGSVITSKLSNIEKDQLKNLQQTAKLAQDDVAQNEKQIKIAKEQADLQKKNLELQQNITKQSRGISDQELKEENETRKQIKEQKQVLEKMLVNDTLTADQVKATSEYQRIQGSIDRKEKRLKRRADRQIMFQNVKQFATFKNIASGIERMKEGILNLPGDLAGGVGGLIKGGAEKAGAGLLMALKAGGLVAAFFGLKAFLDSKLFQQLTEFMKSLAPQFDLIFGGFKKLFQGDIIGGLIDIFKGIAGMIFKVFDAAITGIYNAIARYFGLEETDSVFGSIINTFKAIYEFMKPILDPILQFAKDVFNSIFSGISTIFEGIKGLFSGDFSLENFIKIFGGFADIVFGALRAAINGILGIFGFDGIPDDWTITGAILGAVGMVKNFFADLFSFDLASFVSSVKDKFFSMGRLMKALGKAGVAAAKAILPGGESPGEAFRRVFQENVDAKDIQSVYGTFGVEMSDNAANLMAGNNLNEQQEIANSMPPSQMGNTVVVQSNQNNSSNSSNTQVNQTPIRHNDPTLESLTWTGP